MLLSSQRVSGPCGLPGRLDSSVTMNICGALLCARPRARPQRHNNEQTERAPASGGATVWGEPILAKKPHRDIITNREGSE